MHLFGRFVNEWEFSIKILNNNSMENIVHEVSGNEKNEYFHIITRKRNKNKSAKCSLLVSTGDKKRGRKPKITNSLKEGDCFQNIQKIPELMVNEREKRRISARFTTYLEVIKGERDFFIDDEAENNIKSKKFENTYNLAEEHHRKSNPSTYSQSDHVLKDGNVSLIAESLDVGISDNACIIHVNEEEHSNQQCISESRPLENSSKSQIYLEKDETSLRSLMQNMLNSSVDESVNVLGEFEEFSVRNDGPETYEGEPSKMDSNIELTNIDLHIGESIFGISSITEESNIRSFQISDSTETNTNTEFSPDMCMEMTSIDDSSALFPNVISTLNINNSINTVPSLHLTNDKLDDIPNERRKKYRCKLCSNVYFSLVEARKHAKESHSYAVADITTSSNMNNYFNFKCSDCNQDFPTETGRNKHYLRMHVNNGPVQCFECSISFKSFRPLEKHLLEDHDKNPTNICDMCDKEFVLGVSLAHHKEISHPNRSRFGASNYSAIRNNSRKKALRCNLCNKDFWGIRAMQIHYEKAHDGEAFNCKHCKYKAASSAALTRHLATVHKAIDVFLYNCTVCKVGYSNPCDLEEHYILSHGREPLILCGYCGEKFACVEMLRFHKGKHKAFPCNFCPTGFMKQESLEEHLKTVHKNDLIKEADGLFETNLTNFEFSNTENVDSPHLNSVFTFNDENDSSTVLEINTDGSVKIQEDELANQESIQVHEEKVHHLHHTKEGKLMVMNSENPLKGFRVKDLPKKIRCPVCNKSLTTKFLNTHMRTHRGCLPHKCPKCPKAYAQGTLLRKHMKNKHYEDFLKLGNKRPKQKVQCEFCELMFDDIYGLEEHLWSHMEEKRFQCEICHIKFGMKSSWIEHYKNHYFNEEKSCHICQRSFKSVGYYREHIELCQSKWTCKKCGLKCESPEVYRKHKKMEELGSNALYKCNKCDKAFQSKYGYNIHLNSHSKEKHFSCHICNIKFKQQRLLNHHISRVHCTPEPICSYCSLSFETLDELQSHTKEHLRQELDCPDCDAIYLSRQSLDNHIAVYHRQLSQEPFSCVICLQVFEKQIDMKQHLPQHYSGMSYICKVNGCHKLFKKESVLRFHTIKSHSNLEYICYLCCRKFLMDSDLQRHIAFHNGDFDLKCNKCNFTSSNEGDLHWHTCEYDDVLLYECLVCGSQFTEKENMISHVKSNHDTVNHLENIIVNTYKCLLCEKVFLSQGVLAKHLEHHSIEGVSAEGIMLRTTLSQSLAESSLQIGKLDSENIHWPEVLSSMKFQILFQSENSESQVSENLTATTWQCPTCFFISGSEENMRKHIAKSVSCFENLVEQEESKRSSIPDIGHLASILPEPSKDLYSIENKHLINEASTSSSYDRPIYFVDNSLSVVFDSEGTLSDIPSSSSDTLNLPFVHVIDDKTESLNEKDVTEVVSFNINTTDLLSTEDNVMKLDVPGILINVDEESSLLSPFKTADVRYQEHTSAANFPS